MFTSTGLSNDKVHIIFFIFISDGLDNGTQILPTDSTGNPIHPPTVNPEGIFLFYDFIMLIF